MEVLKKLHDARQIIKSASLKKEGYNDYSKYSYFTPEQVDKLVTDACIAKNLFTKFDLIRHEDKIMGILEITDLDSGTKSDFKMAMEIPEIKATNVSQQLGGAMTYCKRYLMMNAFDIVDNNLDFDTKKSDSKKQDDKTETKEKPWLNRTDKQGNVLKAYEKVINAAKEKGLKIADIEKHFRINKEVKQQLEKEL